MFFSYFLRERIDDGKKIIDVLYNSTDKEYVVNELSCQSGQIIFTCAANFDELLNCLKKCNNAESCIEKNGQKECRR